MLPIFADEIPAHFSYPVIWPTVFTFLAIYIYLKAVAVQRFEKAPIWKIGWLISALVGLGFGLVQVQRMAFDSIYRAVVNDNGMKMTVTHYAAPAIPILLIVAILLYERMARPGIP